MPFTKRTLLAGRFLLCKHLVHRSRHLGNSQGHLTPRRYVITRNHSAPYVKLIPHDSAPRFMFIEIGNLDILVNPAADLEVSRPRSPPVDFRAIPSPPTHRISVSPRTSPNQPPLPLRSPNVDDDVLVIPPRRRPYVPSSITVSPSTLLHQSPQLHRRPHPSSPASNVIVIDDTDDDGGESTSPVPRTRRRVEPRQPSNEELVERLETSMRESRERQRQIQQEQDRINERKRSEDTYFERLSRQMRQHLPSDQVSPFDEALASDDIDRYLEEVRRSRRANNTPRTWNGSSRYTMQM
ncbi:hypothetical protein DM01DRAFT_1383786 [Hesseltinella vesiculosa]|uniref:Uncharacterized protein n=1 Tax=Hesseltinella vesiculosa TaxID=101127 RepID=A0A1X2GGH9_9FUNG|nr:hypothetical protein DM01DRAFT_1383786 [Hesseltinella vesiculosa]